jgi:catechol 2,3-dioxygenase-like lactoylglutathione lyase family enzyme
MARSLRDSLAAKGISLSHSECLETVARQFGFRDWNVLQSKIELETGARKPPPETPGIQLQPAIPVIRILSAEKAKAFYIGFLGFAFDWGEDHGEQPMYAQISRSGVTLHLNEDDDSYGSPGMEIFIRMSGLEALQRELSGKPREDAKLGTYHSGDDRRELHVTDPFGNTLRFSQNNPPGVFNQL